jgi:hypothetical protein
LLTGGEVSCTQSDSGVEITLSGNAGAIDNILQMTIESPAADIKPIPTPVTPKAVLARQ